MAQKRSLNYQRAVDSFDENQRLLGMFEPGRYRGFDGIVSTAGLGAVLGHGTTGILQTDVGNATQTGPVGVWVSPIGTIIQESANLASLTFGTNSANAFERIDAVYGEHSWLASPGGSAAVYGVVQGANGGPVAPVVSNPLIQVVLGYMYIPANATDLSGATYVPASIAMLGNADIIVNHPVLDTRYAQLAAVNTFTAMQKWKQATTLGGISSGNWTPDNGGNVFNFSGVTPVTLGRIFNMGNGTEITIFNPLNTGQTVSLTLGTAASGSFIGIACPTWTTLVGSATMVIKENMGVVLKQINGVWQVIEYSDVLADNVKALKTQVDALTPQVAALVSLPIGGIIPYHGSLALFNAAGLGTGAMSHWALCNGLNGTPDMRGRVAVQPIQIPDTGAPALDAEVDPATNIGGSPFRNPLNIAVGDKLGNSHHVLTGGELPAHVHGFGSNDGNPNNGAGTSPAVGNGGSAVASQTNPAGSGEAHNNYQPFIGLAHIMRIN